jgi:hypothetical protein
MAVHAFIAGAGAGAGAAATGGPSARRCGSIESFRVF